jgi:hypothetical protein
VGPASLSILSDAFEWESIPGNINAKRVTVADAKKNLNLLGAVRIDAPKRGSHHKVGFRGQRSWTLDVNVDPLPDDYIKQLVPVTELPLEVIKTALIYGYMPKKNRLRLSEVPK